MKCAPMNLGKMKAQQVIAERPDTEESDAAGTANFQINGKPAEVAKREPSYRLGRQMSFMPSPNSIAAAGFLSKPENGGD